MNKNALALTFDVGTQSARAMLIDAAGNIVDQKQKTYETAYFSPEAGFAEQDPAMYWSALCETSLALKRDNGDIWRDIFVVTSTCIRATTICLDAEGAPLRSAIVWLDKRKTEKLPPLPLASRLAFGAAGLLGAVNAIRAGLACNWIQVNQPEIWAKTDKFVLLSAYLNLLFCGKLTDSTANTIGVLPYDSKTSAWMKPGDMRRSIYLMGDDKLINLVAPGAVIGSVTRAASEQTGLPEGVPYVVAGADKACETLALTGAEKACAALSFGTTATVEMRSERYFSPLSVMPPYTAINGGFLPEIETFRGYWLVSWFKNEFAAREQMEAEHLGCSAEELLDRRLNEIPPGCNGLILQPTFTPDPITPHARGAVIGFSDIHTRMHFYRAIIEGINFSMMEGLERIERRGKIKAEKIFVAGGGSKSAEICQITANMFGRPVYRIQTHEACGIGCAMVALVSTGVYGDYESAKSAMVRVRDSFTPEDRERETYARLYEDVYCKLAARLEPLNKQLARRRELIINNE